MWCVFLTPVSFCNANWMAQKRRKTKSNDVPGPVRAQMKKAFNECYQAVVDCVDDTGQKRCDLFQEVPDKRVSFPVDSPDSLYNGLYRTIPTTICLYGSQSPSVRFASAVMGIITKTFKPGEQIGPSCSTMLVPTIKKVHGSMSMLRRWRRCLTLAGTGTSSTLDFPGLPEMAVVGLGHQHPTHKGMGIRMLRWTRTIICKFQEGRGRRSLLVTMSTGPQVTHDGCLSYVSLALSTLGPPLYFYRVLFCLYCKIDMHAHTTTAIASSAASVSYIHSAGAFGPNINEPFSRTRSRRVTILISAKLISRPGCAYAPLLPLTQTEHPCTMLGAPLLKSPSPRNRATRRCLILPTPKSKSPRLAYGNSTRKT